jgi:hypothetical protein
MRRKRKRSKKWRQWLKKGNIMEEVDDEVISKPSQPYQCDFCDYSGPRNLDLMDHIDR